MSVYTRLLLTKISFHLKVAWGAELLGWPLHAAEHRVGPEAPALVDRLWPPPAWVSLSGCTGHVHPRAGAGLGVGAAAEGTLSQHPQFPAGLEVTDEVLEKAAGSDVNNM